MFGQLILCICVPSIWAQSNKHLQTTEVHNQLISAFTKVLPMEMVAQDDLSIRNVGSVIYQLQIRPTIKSSMKSEHRPSNFTHKSTQAQLYHHSPIADPLGSIHRMPSVCESRQIPRSRFIDLQET
jgi:hypothetical protein